MPRYGLNEVGVQLDRELNVTIQINLDRNMKRHAALAADLVNLTLPGHAGGRDYRAPDAEAAAARFLALLRPAARQTLETVDGSAGRLVRLARALRPVFESVGDAAAAGRLNALMRRYHARPYLTDDIGQPFHLHFFGDAETAVESLGGEFATALALLMDSYGTRRFGVCQASACDRVYVDLTRNGSRRYCSDACAARAKTAAYRRRQEAEPTRAS